MLATQFRIVQGLLSMRVSFLDELRGMRLVAKRKPVRLIMELPKDIQQFLAMHIESVAELEGLLLMRKENAESFTAEDLAKSLYIGEESAAAVLQSLNRSGFLISDREAAIPSFKYEPASQTLRQATDRIAEFYAQYLIPVTHFIHSRKSNAVQKFADAFRLKEKK